MPVAFESQVKINQIIDLEIPKDDKGNRFPFLLFLPFDFGYGLLIYPDTYPKYDPNNLPQNATIAREDLPYLDLLETSTLLDALTDLNWPPSSGYYPEILKYLSKNINNIDQDILLKMILERFNKDYWRERINYWKLTELFNKRIVYIERAIERYFENDFVSSINVLAPQFEGIVWNYVSANINKKVKIENFKENVRELKKICESRTIVLLKRKMLNVICQYLIEGPLYKSTLLVDPHQQVSRHSIAHPVYTEFENKNLSLKYLLVLDSLAYILNLDRIVSGEFAKGKYNMKDYID